jgi:hypothetical protein
MATYFVRPTNGSDAADGLSFANAFQTSQKAFDTAAVAGDIIRLCPEATETTSVTVDVDTNTGSVVTPIVVEPGNTTDGGRDISLTYTLQASASITGLLQFAGTQDFYKIYNLILDANANAANPLFNNADGSGSNHFIDCRMTGGTGVGVNVRGTEPWHFINCEVDNNDGVGHDSPAAGRGVRRIFGGSVHDNGGDALNVEDNAWMLIGCEVYDNGGSGIEYTSASGVDMRIIGNTFFGNTDDGITFRNAGNSNLMTVYNNTFVSNGGFGVNFNGSGEPDMALYMDFNHTHNNTSGASDITLPGDNNQTGDPLFTSTTDGSEDFIPTSASPLNRNGLMEVTIGARQAADPAGGGGGLIVHPGMTGGHNG